MSLHCRKQFNDTEGRMAATLTAASFNGGTSPPMVVQGVAGAGREVQPVPAHSQLQPPWLRR
jgi:hypothetical protein